MNNKLKKPLSALLTLMTVISLLTAVPMVASAAVYDVKNTDELRNALKNASDGDTVKLTKNITEDTEILIKGKSITFDLNGYTLDVVDTRYEHSGLEIVDGGEVKLINEGEFNVYGYFGAYIWTDSKATVTNVKHIGMYCALLAHGGELVVNGNVEVSIGATGEGDPNKTSVAARASEGGKITINGTIAVLNNERYVEVGSTVKKQSDGYYSVSKPGYLEYTDGTNYVWVKDPNARTVTFESNGGSIPPTQTVASGDKAAKPLPNPTKDGFTFSVWCSDEKLENEFDFNTPINTNITLYAKWAQASYGMSNFIKVNRYAAGQFTDVDEDQWYGFSQQKVIAGAFEYGLMKGATDGHFSPKNNVSIAEAVAIAARIHSIYVTGTYSFEQGSPWYQVYVDYATVNGIIPSDAFADYSRPATRAEIAFIFSGSLPQKEFAGINTVESLPDINTETPYCDSILTLYKAGVIGGSDDKGTFNPENSTNRAETAAIISRVILPETRLRD